LGSSLPEQKQKRNKITGTKTKTKQKYWNKNKNETKILEKKQANTKYREKFYKRGHTKLSGRMSPCYACVRVCVCVCVCLCVRGPLFNFGLGIGIQNVFKKNIIGPSGNT
jgi:hypothetical protein